MQFSFAIIALFAASAFAAPSTAPVAAPAPTVASTDMAGAKSVVAKVAAGCNIGKCVAALAPELIACAAAAAEEGLNPFADAACLASAANNIANEPAACKAC